MMPASATTSYGGGRRGALPRRMVGDALAAPRAVADRDALARALAERPATPALGGATAAALGLRAAGRIPGLGFLARRTPLWLLATAVPALVASVARGADELGLVASHLVHRARAEGIEPDAERVRRAAVQIASHRVVDPEREPSHGPLVVSWMRRAVRAALPFTSGVATRDPDGLAAAAAAVDPARLSAGLAPRAPPHCPPPAPGGHSWGGTSPTPAMSSTRATVAGTERSTTTAPCWSAVRWISSRAPSPLESQNDTPPRSMTRCSAPGWLASAFVTCSTTVGRATRSSSPVKRTASFAGGSALISMSKLRCIDPLPQWWRRTR